jgi:hypothetical protein
MSKLQTLILQNIIQDNDFCRKVIPHIRKKYFEGTHRGVFGEVTNFVVKYGKLPDKSSLLIQLEESSVSDDRYTEMARLIDEVYEPVKVESIDWLLDKTERWCQDSACELAVLDAVKILNGEDVKHDRGMIPKLFKDALAVTFDNSVGHDYLHDAAKRWERYHTKTDKIPFSLEVFNEVTDGGYEKKTLNIFIAGIHVGKSLMMAAMAADAIMANKKVLYISMEMAEEKVAERVDANLMNREISDLGNIAKDDFVKKVEKIKAKTDGNLIVKQYPTAGAHVGHFRALLEDLKVKKEFTPDVVFVDYLNICASERIRGIGGNNGTYILVKSIAEELRGLAVEYQVPVWSATQFTRDGMDSSDPSMTQTSESIGLPATVDLMWALSQPDQFKENGQYLVKQLKNRYKDIGYKEKFVIGVDKPKMQVFDLDGDAQLGIMDSSGNMQTESKDFNFDFNV